MRVIKCDLCKKELAEYENNIRYLEDKTIDLCENCNEIYEKCDTEIANRCKEIRAKYENEIKEETQKTLNKYGIGGKSNEEEGI